MACPVESYRISRPQEFGLESVWWHRKNKGIFLRWSISIYMIGSYKNFSKGICVLHPIGNLPFTPTYFYNRFGFLMPSNTLWCKFPFPNHVRFDWTCHSNPILFLFLCFGIPMNQRVPVNQRTNMFLEGEKEWHDFWNRDRLLVVFFIKILPFPYFKIILLWGNTTPNLCELCPMARPNPWTSIS